ncbi:uncharacterized protein Z520_03950 [Fonsecaea multimorphosa CBS 102226]|uniref:AB hydrolase-1 domain-containing protein n=1 Tax=Fonsecaea multimorphosa CBS 102226 TaxID=1442371 RepID=A0A0D2KAU0_9EURO|nr:uncharacterized protein Z520_03950 [Fonsecaea multimorphosa CBS 102226]KIY00265.1 hypothetical protein Z520_03950 [Fonsecaea multimorphosa CBS 102226]
MTFPDNFKTLTLLSGVTYGYVHVAASPYKSTILFLHGFPSSSYGWRHQVSHFASAGYGVLAPDLLGYGATDQPQSAQEYTARKMASEIVEILDHETIRGPIHGVGHDWGSFLLSRLANYHRERFQSYSFLDVAYMVPGVEFDVDAFEESAKAQFGYVQFGFWKFLIEDDAAALIGQHFDSFHSLLYAADAAMWKDHLGPKDALRAWLTTNQIGPLADYITQEGKIRHREIFQDNYGPATNWYRAFMANLNQKDEKETVVDPHLRHPVVLITASRDPVAIPAMMESWTRPFAKDLRIHSVDAGHWVQIETKNEVNRILQDFFSEVE